MLFHSQRLTYDALNMKKLFRKLHRCKMTASLVVLFLLLGRTIGQVPGGPIIEANFEGDLEPFYCRNSLHGAVNDFILKLTRLFEHDGNFFISPLSISVALTMVYYAASGNTVAQMDSVLEYVNHGLTKKDVAEGFRDIFASLAEEEADGTLTWADGMFLQNGFAVDEVFVGGMRDMFGAVIKYMNFAGDGLAAIREINSWVAKKTHNKITWLFEEPADAKTRMMMLSAVYFKGAWDTPFPKKKSLLADFHRPDGTVKIVNMMTMPHISLPFLYDDLTEYKFLQLPYSGHLALLLALPGMIDAPADLEMTSELLCEINDHLKVTELRDVAIPKFQIDFLARLRQPLQSLGLTDLFQNCAANLTRIRRAGDLHVDDIIHRAVLRIDEGEGSEAVELLHSSLEEEPREIPDYPVTFVANHPFLLYVMDRRNGMVLMSGRVTDPDLPDTAVNMPTARP